MLKRLLLSGAALSAFASFAVAQTTIPVQTIPSQTNNAPNNTPAAQDAAPAPSMGGMAAQPNPAAAEVAAQTTEDPNLLSNLLGADIVGPDKTAIGRVADVLIDASGQLRQVVIGTGGLVGIGETLRTYDVAELPALDNGQVMMGQMTTASIDALPEYKYPEDTETGRASTSATTGSGTEPQPNVAAGTPRTDAASASMNSNAETAPAASDTGLWPASYLVGANITNAQGSAEINDLRFEGNRVAAALIEKGGVLGIGDDVKEVAFNDLVISGTRANPEIGLKPSGATKADVPVNGAPSPAQ